jgi:hypothetical protein
MRDGMSYNVISPEEEKWCFCSLFLCSSKAIDITYATLYTEVSLEQNLATLCCMAKKACQEEDF